MISNSKIKFFLYFFPSWKLKKEFSFPGDFWGYVNFEWKKHFQTKQAESKGVRKKRFAPLKKAKQKKNVPESRSIFVFLNQNHDEDVCDASIEASI